MRYEAAHDPSRPQGECKTTKAGVLRLRLETPFLPLSGRLAGVLMFSGAVLKLNSVCRNPVFFIPCS
jgi:hypothetical protein